MSIGSRRLWLIAALLLRLETPAFAQRELHWDDLSVTARLAADGSLHVTEEQTMVFSGDWNGGERTFNLRPRQTLSFEGMSHWTGNAWEKMNEGASLANVNQYAFTDAKTLRWRSRMTSDPPFNRTAIRYQLRYTLANILLTDGERYTLDHDFAFPDRVGPIDRFELHLIFDPAWQPLSEVHERYSANGLAPGKRFPLTIPLRYVGAGTPAAFDQSRSPEVRIAVLAILGLTLLSVLWVFASEHAKGRFVPIDMSSVDEAWLREHILKFPAELVSAAWDDSIGQPEVVTLLARMTAEGKLESQISGGKHSGMTLRLKVDRGTLAGYERKLVDALFFGDRTMTSTDEVKSHYHKTGFNPVSLIQSDLAAALKAAFPFGDASKAYGFETLIFFVVGLALLVTAWLVGDLPGLAVFLLFIGSVILAGLASISGMRFRQHMEGGRRAAVLSLIPPLTIAGAAAAFVWYFVGTDRIQLSTVTLEAVVALALGAVNTSINALRSRQRRDGVAFRKQLTAGRLFFMSELRKPQPALRDEWYPWVLAFELGKAMDDWSATSSNAHQSHGTTFASSSGSSSSSSSSSTWTGFGGGRSGGAGAGATWAAAAGGLAAGVAAPSSSSSSGGGGGGGGGSSSGGGGGGGW